MDGINQINTVLGAYINNFWSENVQSVMTLY